MLAQREHSAMELRRKLLRIARDRDARLAAGADGGNEHEVGEDTDDDGAPNAEARGEEVDAVLVWLQANGYLDESRFIESRIHVRSQRFGQRRIEQELAQHGLSLDVEQRAQLAVGELERACDLLRRKFGATAPADAAAEAKRMRFLIGRGFGSDVVRRAVRQVAADIDPDA
ncbi:regulatory protein RecX [Roseateles aquatilis]|nr:regulatory protein RecX [Roseateles aquatilis]